jgi:hypothetical protein
MHNIFIAIKYLAYFHCKVKRLFFIDRPILAAKGGGKQSLLKLYNPTPIWLGPMLC